MNSIFAFFFSITILMQPVTAFAADYSDFDSFCQTLQQHEFELIKKEVEQGLMSEVEAEEEIDYVPKVEQCVCFFEKVLEGTDADFTLYMQKGAEIELMADLLSDEDYRIEELRKQEMPKYPNGMDIVAFVSNAESICGFDPE